MPFPLQPPLTQTLHIPPSQTLMDSQHRDQSTPPKLPLLTKSLDHYSVMGMVTPPHHAASVPFTWEEEPGKPRPTNATTPEDPVFKSLGLPPRLLNGSKLAKTSSPTMILEGAYVGRSIFHSSRSMMCKEVSFDGVGTAERSLVLSKRWLVQGEEVKGSTSWRKTGLGLRRGKEVVDESGLVFCGDASVSTRKRRGLLGRPTKAKFSFWGSICEALKQVIPSTRRTTNGKWGH